MTPADFIAAIAAGACACMAKTRIPASFTIAQAALESGWCHSALAFEARNLFGVKADASWHGETIDMPTREYLRGQWVTVPAKWRKYLTWETCIEDHAGFLLYNPRYHAAFEHCDDVEAFVKAIAKAGYATDPDYPAKVISIIQSHDLKRFDQGGSSNG
jgi:flagellum-specific peptidoglycan hydrolase FlgJ